MRYGVAFLALVLVLGALAAIKWSQIATVVAYGQEASRRGPPPEAVSAAPVVEQQWEETLTAVGTVAANEDVSISAEVPGRVQRIAFESGASARRGDLLVVLDSASERADLESARANANMARLTMTRTRALFDRRVASAEMLERAETELAAATARVAQLRAILDKKMIRAPFSGRLGIRAVHPGEYVAAGATLTTLGSLDRLFADFTLPQERIDDVSVGMRARVRVGGARARTLEGSIAAIEPTVDLFTRSVRLRAVVEDPGGSLRPGMFVDVEVVRPERRAVLAVPATAIVHAPYGDSVFVIEERENGAPGAARTPDGHPIEIARQQFVQIGERRGDFVEIRQGLSAGQHVVSAGAFKLHNRTPIYITPDDAPSPQLAPRPENR